MKRIITLSLFATMAFFASCDDETTKKENRASVFSLNLTQQTELSSALNRGEINPPPY